MQFKADDDYVDRLSRHYTVLLLISLAFLVSSRQFVGSPIVCWCPAQFTKSHREYTETVCWVSNTYYLPSEEGIPKGDLSHTKQESMVSYYQWVPFILMFQAVLTFVPSQIWRFFNHRSGVSLVTIMDAAHACSRASYIKIREEAIRYVVKHMDRYLLAQRDYRTGRCIQLKHFLAKMCCLIGGRLYGNYLTTSYMFVKLLYLTNCVGQLFLLDIFVGDYYMYGIQVVHKFIQGEDWSISDRFPRITICELEIRHQSAKIHNYVVQCVLTINLFNEKIFMFLWFWLVFLALLNIFSLARWFFRAIYWPGQVHYAKKQLRAFDVPMDECLGLTKFIENYLRRDGMFIVRLIGSNMGEVVAGEVICGLWDNYNLERRRPITEHPGRKTLDKSRQKGRKRMEMV